MIQNTNKKFLEKHPYLAKCFNKKTLVEKAIILACALVIVVSLSLSFYLWLRSKEQGTVIGQNSFWYIEIQWNDGIGWSKLAGNTAAIYAIQSLVFIALTCVFVFVTNNRISASFIALAMFGGLFNLIQRAATPLSVFGGTNPSVLDYFKFGFFDFPIFNWPDTFVVIGVFGFVISYITYVIIQSVKESRLEKYKKKHEQN